MMSSPLELKVKKRAVTSMEYRWPIQFDPAEHKVYHSPTFPADPTEAADVIWRLKLKTSSRHSCVTIDLYASPKSISSICLSYAFDPTFKYDKNRKLVSEIKTYDFDTAQKEDGWIHIGGWSQIFPGDNKQNTGPLLSILCTIDIVDEQKDLSTDALFYTIPSGGLWQNFEALLTSGKDADVTLVSKDNIHKINAHKLILMARSPVFNAMFSNEMSESLNKLVVLDDIDGEVLDELVRFIYTERVSNLSATANRLLLAADKYDLPTLRAICEQEIGISLSVENAAETLVLADLHQAHQLKKHTLRFFALHGKKVLATDGWKEIKAKHPGLVIEVCESLAV